MDMPMRLFFQPVFSVIAQPRTPHLMVAAQYDSWQLSHLVHGYDGLEEKPKAYTAAEQRYAEVGRAERKWLGDGERV